MDEKIIYGIQQIGIGVSNAIEATKWYATKLGADILVFEDHNEATHMAPYMGGKSHKKSALLTMNLHGGGGYEIWQYSDRTPVGPDQAVQIGDLGINFITIKTKDAQNSHKSMKAKGVNVLSDVTTAPDGKQSFFIEDPYQNVIQIKEFNSWFKHKKTDVGGVYSCTLGVSNIEKTKILFADILGYNKVVYDVTETFDDLSGVAGGKNQMRRVLLKPKQAAIGGFSDLLGRTQIELIQVLDRTPVKIFKDRYWGDLGYIHLCFDVKNMPALVKQCAEKGMPFKVLSEVGFDMGDANGDWGYIEDPDGTLIEFVQTNKIPILKKINWHIDLSKRDPRKPLPRFLIKAMGLNKVKV